MLLLHGTGGDEHDLLPLAAQLSPGSGTLAPRGAVQEAGMNRWFRRIREGVFDVDDVVRRSGDLAAFIEWATTFYEFRDRPLIAVGFSNGANIALATTLLHPGILPAVVAFCGMHPLDGITLRGDLDTVSVALFNGDADPMAPQASVDQLAAVLQSRRATVSRNLRPGGHGIRPSEVTAAAEWIRRRAIGKSEQSP